VGSTSLRGNVWRRAPVARLWEPLSGRPGYVRCLVCERRCPIAPGARGACGNYYNNNGVLRHIGYGRLSAVESRPIEIKPLFHFWPNSTALTFSGWGCNFYCPWCQNHHLSFRHPQPEDKVIEPGVLVRLALRAGDEGLCASFNEPATLFDYLLDVFELGKKHGLYGSIVTNGYFTLKAVEMLVEAGVEGWSIDIKGCPKLARKGILPTINHEIVFRNARRVLDLGGHVEMVHLVVTGANDDPDCFEWIIDMHLKYLGSSVPLHINRYYPAHRWHEPPTPIRKLLEWRERALKAGIEFVYVGNIGSPELESTYCPKCGKLLIRREGYRVTYFNLDCSGGRCRCPRCGYPIPIKGKYIPNKPLPLFW
jgi:pyruvate formate lyase activating enzyme